MPRALGLILILLCALASAKSWFFPAGASFSPMDIAGLQLRLYGNDTTKFNSGSISNNDPVSSWTDLSTNAYVWSQGTSARKPIYKTNTLNGKNCVKFTDQVLAPSTETYIQTGQPFEILFVLRIDAVHVANDDAAFFKSNAALKAPGIGWRNTDGFMWFGDAAITWTFGNWAHALDSGGAFHWILYGYNGSGATTRANFSFAYDGTDLGAMGSAAAANGLVATSFLGNYSNASDPNFSGDMTLCDLFVYQHAFSAGELANFDTWIFNQYGI